ncbi:hypothetical protein DACRYDRAFT_118924 [Dacryopinax primogenitus]|uniref:Uncharacterized protein n=1 Tax=Dacryopinax primogenitus (strain DJM 731) TaxID=1858805 RepID=M5FSM5_DACPD|nr:uncharacterized protein DACRYDRAFT_118924 [Dacryopinax primogenitus]EJT98199.1 hypothetical protein DACRYDRAFT_118924 [Dacryopinax primogenitus]
MLLCSNRTPVTGSPSTCTLDVVVIPLASWILMASLPLTVIVCSKRRQALPLSRTRLQKKIWILYLVLIVADIAMTVLEIARLAVAQLGVGLLPFNTVGLIIAVVLVGIRGSTFMPLFFFWLLLVIFQAIKVHQLMYLPSKTPDQYPGSDQLLDNAIMLGLESSFVLLDTYDSIVHWKHRLRTHDALVMHPALSEGNLPLQPTSEVTDTTTTK